MDATPARAHQPWLSHYKAHHIQVLFEAPMLRILEATFAGGDQVPMHVHSHVVDHFWVLDGRLDIETVNPDQRIQLGAGGYFAIAAGRAHRVRNSSNTHCHFINLQGYGSYDFEPLEDAP